MFSLRWKNNPEQEIQALMDRFAALPRHIAKKHLQAAMKRTMKGGVPVLKAITPKGGARNVTAATTRNSKGQFTAGSGKKSRVKGGALRRAVTTKSKYIGKNADGMVYGIVGYRAGLQSRKAIWLEFGTKNIRPQSLIERFKRQYGGPSLATLTTEMAAALEKGAKELAAGKNPGKVF
jgi:hypothetical protein